MVHAHLEHAISRVARHARQGQRHAPLVVEAARRGEARGLALEGALQRLLGAGLADAAGDADDRGGAAPARGAAEILERGHRVGDEQQRSVRGDARGHARDQRRCGAPLERGADVIMAIEFGAGEGDEEVARCHRAAVDRDAARAPLACAAAAGRSGGFGGGP